MLNVSTKQGKLQTTETTVRLANVWPMKGVKWEYPLNTLVKIDLQLRGTGYNAVLTFTDHREVVEMIPMFKVKQIRSAFPLDTPVSEIKGIEWYKDIISTVHVAIYKNIQGYQTEAERVLSYGWSITDVTIEGRKFSVGKAIVGSVVSFGLGAVAGLSGKKGKVIVTYTK